MINTGTMLDPIYNGLALVSIAFIWVIILVRIVGLRALSKMTSFDFVATIAVGSLLASASQSTSLDSYLQSLAAIGGVFLLQVVLAVSRKQFKTLETLIENTPVLLMRDGQILDAALKSTRVAKDDLLAKLRAANVLSFSDVRAAVLETTGDVSIIHGNALEESILEGVKSIRRPSNGQPT